MDDAYGYATDSKASAFATLEAYMDLVWLGRAESARDDFATAVRAATFDVPPSTPAIDAELRRLADPMRRRQPLA